MSYKFDTTSHGANLTYSCMGIGQYANLNLKVFDEAVE